MNKIDVIGEVRALLKNRDPEKFTIMVVAGCVWRDTLKELSSMAVQKELRHGFIVPDAYDVDDIYPFEKYEERGSTTEPKPHSWMLAAIDQVYEHKNKHLLPFDVILLPFVAKVVLKKALELLKPDGLLIFGHNDHYRGHELREQRLREQALTVAMQAGFAEPTIKTGSNALVFDFSKPVLAPEIKLPAPLLAKMAKML